MQKIVALLLVLAGIGGGAALGLSLRPAPPAAGGKEADAAAATPAHEASAGAGAGVGEHGSGSEGETASAEAPAPSGSGHGAARKGAVIEAGDHEYISIGRQMIIPVVEGGTTRALMLFELAVEVPRGETERVYHLEPRLRDAFLRVLFELSHTGAFLDTYTDERVVEELRGKLLAAARRYLGEEVADVLILDIVRQEL